MPPILFFFIIIVLYAIIFVVKGLEISKAYYEEFGAPMIKEQFPELEPKIAVGLIGSGSECFGFDDRISTDHDFDPGFLMFISDEVDEDTKFKLERAYAKLPREYKGYTREIMSPVGGNRRGVKRISDFLREKTGRDDGNLSVSDWFSIPEESLAELTNGEIWRDDSKIISGIRLRLSTFPEDIKLKKIAGELLMMAQSGQYNYERCVAHNEFGAAKLAIYEFVKASMHVAFLLNEVYMPFYKWRFRALRDLSWPKSFKIKSELNYISGIEDDSFVEVRFEEKLEALLSITDEKIINDKVKSDIELIARTFIERLKNDGLSERNEIYLERHAYEVNNKIKNVDIRNMNILAAV